VAVFGSGRSIPVIDLLTIPRPVPMLTLICNFRELQREKVWSRIHLVPLLLAEGDRDAYRRQHAAREREKEIMKDVKGWEVSSFTNLKHLAGD
jgi:hypothetical protein